MPSRARRLLLVTDAWAPQTNGVVTTYQQTIKRLRARGVHVDVIHPGLFSTLPLPGYAEIRVAWPIWQVGRHIEAAAPDIVHIATEGPLGMAARRYLRRRNRRFTSAVHTRFPEYLKARIGTPLSWGYRVLRRFHRPAWATLVTTKGQQRELSDWGFPHLVVWGRGVEMDHFHPRRRERALPIASQAAADAPVLLYVGRVAVEKNLRAFLDLECAGEKWIVGDGPDRKSLQRRYPGARWFGYRYGDELAQLYADADVFVFPSRTDTFGLVMLEAMASGTPVAAFPVTGPVDVVTEGVTGCLHDDLEQAVQGALRLDRDACRRAAEACSWERTVDVFEDTVLGAAENTGALARAVSVELEPPAGVSGE